MITYESCLEAAGATVHCVEYFGSYQGDIWAKISFNGEIGWLNIPYGSCSGCDSLEGFKSDLGWDHDMTKEEEAQFGKDYLDSLLSQKEAEKLCMKYSDWDSECKNILSYLQNNRI